MDRLYPIICLFSKNVLKLKIIVLQLSDNNFEWIYFNGFVTK